jgi:hypothetical protein
MLDKKHLMGQHDQREHRGDRYTGRYSEEVKPQNVTRPSMNKLSMSIGRTEGRFVGKQALIGFLDNNPRSKLENVRNEIVNARKELIQSKSDWDLALRAKNPLKAQLAADIFAKQMAKIEELRNIYNKAIEDYRSITNARLGERNNILKQLREEYSLASFDISIS